MMTTGAVSYGWDGEDLFIEGAECPDCGSQETEFDPLSGFWECKDCSFTWEAIHNPDEDIESLLKTAD